MKKEKHEIINALQKRKGFKIKLHKRLFAKAKGRRLAKKGDAVLEKYIEARIAEFKKYCESEKLFLMTEAFDYLICRNASVEKPVYREVKTNVNSVSEKRQNKINQSFNANASRKYFEEIKAINEGKEFLNTCEEIVDKLLNTAREELTIYLLDVLSGACKYVKMSIDDFDFTLKEVDYV